MTEPRRLDVFARAQLRLALLFALLVVALIAASSVLLYVSVRGDVRRAAAQEFESTEEEDAYVASSLGEFGVRLIEVGAAIIIVVGAGGLLYARRTLRPIRENVAAQRRFIADASHDLRTPLAVMKTDFEVALRDHTLAPELRPILESGLEEVDSMSAIVEDLLTLSRIDARQEELAREPLDLAELARQTVEKLGGLAAVNNVSLTLGDGPSPLPAVGDAGHVRRALANIVRNAIEHSLAAGVVEVRVGVAGGMAVVSVADHGAGMTPDVLAHVFDRFYRADPSRSRTGNSGLGLAIARWALREMGGDIAIESRVGDGTTVTMSLMPPS